MHIMTTTTIHVFILFCTQAKYELGLLPELRPHVRRHIPGKVAAQDNSCEAALGWSCLVRFYTGTGLEEQFNVLILLYYCQMEVIGC